MFVFSNLEFSFQLRHGDYRTELRCRCHIGESESLETGQHWSVRLFVRGDQVADLPGFWAKPEELPQLLVDHWTTFQSQLTKIGKDALFIPETIETRGE